MLLAFVLASGCKRSERRSTAPGSGPRASGAASSIALPPFTAASWRAELELPGFGSSSVALPLGATGPRPVVVVLHGDYDQPEWPCGTYRGVVGARAFVLCLRGVPVAGGRFGLAPLEETRKELRAALTALKARYGAHVAQGAVALAALGPAVDQAFALALEEPSFFAYLVLVDGSLGGFTPPRVKRFADGGGRRVLFLCTRLGCGSGAGAGVATSPTYWVLALRSAGVEARAEKVPAASGLDGHAAAALKQHWPWLVAEDPRWKAVSSGAM